MIDLTLFPKLTKSIMFALIDPLELATWFVVSDPPPLAE